MEQERNEGGLSCMGVLTRLGEYVDGDLPAAERALVNRHLRGCAVCELFGGRYASVVSRARARLGVVPAVDESIVARIRGKL